MSTASADTAASTTTYALLALLAVRPWSGYELTKQARRSLRYVWPSSEAHLYREQRRLVQLGWAEARKEHTGARPRTMYRITRTGRAALRRWLRTRPESLNIEIEGVLRVFFAEFGEVADAQRALERTAQESRARIDELLAFANEYLTAGSQFSERLHMISVAMEILTRSYGELERACREALPAVGRWADPAARGMSTETRRRLEQIVRRSTR